MTDSMSLCSPGQYRPLLRGGQPRLAEAGCYYLGNEQHSHWCVIKATSSGISRGSGGNFLLP